MLSTLGKHSTQIHTHTHIYIYIIIYYMKYSCILNGSKMRRIHDIPPLPSGNTILSKLYKLNSLSL